MKRLLAGLSLLALLLIPQSAMAFDLLGNACTTPGASSSSASCTNHGNNTNSLTGGNGVLYKVTRIVAILGGIAAVIIMIVGGFLYVISQGDPQKTSQARSTIIYAVVGLVVIILAQSIITFILSRIG